MAIDATRPLPSVSSTLFLLIEFSLNGRRNQRDAEAGGQLLVPRQRHRFGLRQEFAQSRPHRHRPAVQ